MRCLPDCFDSLFIAVQKNMGVISSCLSSSDDESLPLQVQRYDNYQSTVHQCNNQSAPTQQLLNKINEHMKIFVRTQTGEKVCLKLESFTTMKEVKGRINDKEGIPTAQQYLYLNERELKDEYTLFDYNIDNGYVLYLLRSEIIEEGDMRVFIKPLSNGKDY